MNRASWLMAMLGCLLAGTGCAKRVSSPDLKFEAQQRVILTFRGGEQIQGRIDIGKRVELREPGVVWTAQVGEVTEDQIVLKNLVQVRATKSVGLEVARSEDARHKVGEDVPDKTLLRSEITGVDLLRTDAGKTARTVSFWTYSAVILALVMGERS